VDQYVVIGNPVGHSKSPYIHQQFASTCGQEMQYQTLLAPLDGFAETVRQFIAAGGRGANVTVPFKLEAFNLATELSPCAQAAGAVNTLRFSDKGIYGDNTDGAGLVMDICKNAGINLASKRILLLGAGGAARGALLPLLKCQPRELVIANRSIEKAQLLAQQFAEFGPIVSCELAQLAGAFDVVINATSASLSEQIPAMPAHVFGPSCLAYDMMYADKPTRFMVFAREHGAIPRDGWGMLVEQAAEAFYGWRGIRPDTTALLAKV